MFKKKLFLRDSYGKTLEFYLGILRHQAQKAANSQMILPKEKYKNP